jgi:hypothetical protein
VKIRTQNSSTRKRLFSSARTLENVPDGHSTRHARSYLVFLIAFLVGAFLLIRILVPNGIVGRHWDWDIPATADGLRNMASSSLSIWGDTGLGSFISFRDGVVLLEFIVGLPGYFGLSGAFVAKLFLLGCLSGSGIGMFRFLESVVSSKTAIWRFQWVGPLVGAMFYMASPYQFDQIIAGDSGGLVAYAILPFAMRRFLQSARIVGESTHNSESAYQAIIAGLEFGIAFACSAQPTILAALVVLFFALTTHWRSVYVWRCLAIVGAVAILTNSYWLVVGLLSGHFVSTASTVTNTSLASATYGQYHSVLATAEGWSYVVTFFWNGLDYLSRIVWSAVVFSLIFVSIAGSLFTQQSSKHDVLRRMARTSCLLFPFAIVFAIPANHHLGSIDRFLYSFHLFALLFRTPQHLVFPTVLVSAVLIGLGVSLIMRSLALDPSIRVLSGWASLLVALGIFAASGFVDSNSFAGYIGPNHVTTAEGAVYNYLNTHGSDQGREIFFPGGPNEYFASSGPGNFSLDAGDDGDILWSRHSPIASDALWNPIAATSYLQLSASSELLNDPQNALGLLSLLSVQYVVVSPFYGPSAGPLYGVWNTAFAHSQLLRVPGLKMVFHRGNWYVYKNEEYQGLILPTTITPALDPILATALSVGSTTTNLVAASMPSSTRGSELKRGVDALVLHQTVLDESGRLAATNWIPVSGVSSQLWNYFFDLNEPYMSLDAPPGQGNLLSFRIDTQTVHQYQVRLAIVAPGRGWSLIPKMNGTRLPVVRGTGIGAQQIRVIDVGVVKLQKTNVFTLQVNCPACAFGVFGVVASNPVVKPACSVMSSAMSNSSNLKAKVMCRSKGSIVLSDSYSTGWNGVAIDVSGRSIRLTHVEVDKSMNGWIVPAGSWTVSLEFTPERTYELTLIIWLGIMLGLILSVFVLRGGRRGGRKWNFWLGWQRVKEPEVPLQ